MTIRAKFTVKEAIPHYRLVTEKGSWNYAIAIIPGGRIQGNVKSGGERYPFRADLPDKDWVDVGLLDFRFTYDDGVFELFANGKSLGTKETGGGAIDANNKDLMVGIRSNLSYPAPIDLYRLEIWNEVVPP